MTSFLPRTFPIQCNQDEFLVLDPLLFVGTGKSSFIPRSDEPFVMTYRVVDGKGSGEEKKTKEKVGDLVV